MLVQFKVQNFTSFNTCQSFNLFSSTSTKENFSENNSFQINKFGINNILKSAAIFGANASGKSNFIDAMRILRSIILKSLSSTEADNLKSIIPFFLKDKPFNIPTEFEISFIQDGCLYRYGIAITNGLIDEEWLYYIKNSRETVLFHREKQTIKINRRSFSEAKDFIRKKGEVYFIEKTREDVPFVAVLAQFNGQKSRKVIDWFKKLNVASGLGETGYKRFTFDLFEKDRIFKAWALEILSSLQIDDIRVIEEDEDENRFPLPEDSEDNDLNNAVSSLKQFLQKAKLKVKKLEIIKKVDNSSKEFIIPFELESTGTKKLICLLGPLYDVIKNSEILLIDEFDSKFHSLLSNFIIDLYHKNNKSNSQLIITCHDTNLLSKDIFRRDQVWFIEKNQKHESEIYSLVEFKEHYTRKDNNYSKDYLSGKYGAIPLFKSMMELEMVLNG